MPAYQRSPRADLRELNRCPFVERDPADFFTIRYCAVRIEKPFRDLEITAADDEPISLEQGRYPFLVPTTLMTTANAAPGLGGR
jgi:hypothetical protein